MWDLWSSPVGYHLDRHSLVLFWSLEKSYGYLQRALGTDGIKFKLRLSWQKNRESSLAGRHSRTSGCCYRWSYRKAGRKAVFYLRQFINSGERYFASLSLCFLICLIEMLISFQRNLLVEIRWCTRFPTFLLVQMKCLPSFSPSAILFGLPLRALATGPPVPAVVDLFPPTWL